MLLVSRLPAIRFYLRIRGFVRLVRPGNLLILACAVLVGGLLGGGIPPAAGDSLRVLIAALSAVLVAAGGNALNDVLDVRVDAVNRPTRPIPAGTVGVRSGWVIWAGSTALGVLLGLALSFTHAMIAAGCALLLYAYSFHLKRIPLAGNVAVAVLAGVAVLYGALLFSLTSAVWAGAGFAFGTTLAREIVKDVEDVVGDREAGMRTAPVLWGEFTAALMAAGVLLLTVAASPIPFLYLNYGGIYLLGVLVTDAVLLRAVWVLLEQGDRFAARASGVVKWGMVSGIIALALFWAR